MEYLQNQYEQERKTFEMLVSQTIKEIGRIEKRMEQVTPSNCSYIASQIYMMHEILKTAEINMDFARRALEDAQRE